MAFDSGDAGLNIPEHAGVVLREAVADGVGKIEGGGAGLDGGLADLDQEVGVGAGGVLGGELDVVAVGAREGDHLGDLVERLGACDLELGGEVQVGCGEEGVDAGAGGGLDGARGGLDVLALGAGEGGDDGASDLAGDVADGFGVALGGDGEAGLQDVDAESGDLVGHAQLLGAVHDAAGRLFAVAQGGVEEEDAAGLRLLPVARAARVGWGDFWD